FLAVFVAGHQSERAGIKFQAYLDLVGLVAVDIERRNAVARQRTAHRSWLQRLAWRVADLRGGFGLAEAVAKRQSPRLPDLVDDLRIERLARADQLAQLQPAAVGGEVFLDQHSPHGRRRAERRHAAALERCEQPGRAEARDAVDEDARARVPGREEAAPGMLGPARRRDVQVDVARLQADPEHRRQMPDWIALMRMEYELGLRGRTRGEVEQQRIGRARLAVRFERSRLLVGRGV